MFLWVITVFQLQYSALLCLVNKFLGNGKHFVSYEQKLAKGSRPGLVSCANLVGFC